MAGKVALVLDLLLMQKYFQFYLLHAKWKSEYVGLRSSNLFLSMCKYVL